MPRPRLVALVFFALTASLLSQSNPAFFAPAVTYGSGGQYTVSIAVADVNGDGKPDVAVANLCADVDCNIGSVGVLLANPDGTFQPAVTYGAGGYYPVESVAMADVNLDGKPDLIATNLCASRSNCTHGTAGVLLGDGDGTFQTAMAFDSGGYSAFSMAVGDVNGDRKPDLLAANFYGSLVANSYGSVGVLTDIIPFVQQPINSDGSSTFKASRGVIPVKFNNTPTCALLPATISVTRTAGATIGPVDEGTYSMAADSGSNFRIDPTDCQYVYNLAASALGAGTYRVDISIEGIIVGHAVFALK